MLKVEVNRKRWGRGTGDGSLLRDGKMCCLGFVCRKVGLSAEEIKHTGEPIDVVVGEKVPKAMRGLYNKKLDGRSKVCRALVRYNDDSVLSDKQREKKIISYGRKAGIEFTFVN